jgi:ABC-type transport system substrate-binding protein
VGNIVTNGPFRLESWQRGQSMVLVRNPAYHGRFRGNVQRVKLSLFSSAEWSAAVTIQVTGTFAQISNTKRNSRRMKVHFE